MLSKDKMLNIAFTLLFGLILFPTKLKSIVILISSLLIFYSVTKKKLNLKYFLINSSVYIYVFFTILYSTNINQGLLKIQTMLSLLLFPLLFSLLSKEQVFKLYSKRKVFFLVFIFSVIIFYMFVFLWFWMNYFSFFDTIKHFEAILNNEIGGYRIHPIYLTIHCCVAIIFCLFIFVNFKLKTVLFLIPILLTFLFLTPKKGPIISLCIIIFIFTIMNFKTNKILLGLTIVTMLIVLLQPRVVKRFVEITKIEKLTENTINSTNIRWSIYESSIRLVKKSFLFGYGIGDANDALVNQYKIDNKNLLVKDSYNSHNQFLGLLIIGGFFLLLIFLGVFSYNVFLNFKAKNFIYIFIGMLYLISMTTENILERESGVIFFSFFTSFLGLKGYLRES